MFGTRIAETTHRRVRNWIGQRMFPSARRQTWRRRKCDAVRADAYGKVADVAGVEQQGSLSGPSIPPIVVIQGVERHVCPGFFPTERNADIELIPC